MLPHKFSKGEVKVTHLTGSIKRLPLHIFMIKIFSKYDNWEPVIKELTDRASFLIGRKDIKLERFNLVIMPTQEYMEGRFGIERGYLSRLFKDKQEGITVLHAKDFPIQGAGGWFSYINGKPFIQFYGDHLRLSSNRWTKEFNYWSAEVIAHELCHKYYRKHGFKDKTHYFHYEVGSLMQAFEDIRKQLLKEQKSLLERAIELYRKLLQPRHEEETTSRDYTTIKFWCIHHSATSRDHTRAETIINNQKQQYGGKTFYDAIIDKDGIIYRENSIKKARGTDDVCVIGDFTKEKPTDKQVKALKSLLDGHRYITHKELAEQGKAEASVCPGNLMDYVAL